MNPSDEKGPEEPAGQKGGSEEGTEEHRWRVPQLATEQAVYTARGTASEETGTAGLIRSGQRAAVITEETQEVDERTLQQLRRLFDLLRVTKLNSLYYGCRAEKYEGRQRAVQVGTALLAGIATILLVLPFTGDAKYWATMWATVLAGVATLVGSVAPYFQLGERAKQTYALHSAHKHLVGRVDTVIAEIRKTDAVTSEQIRAVDELRSLFVQVEAGDEPETDDETKNRLDEDVRKAFPDDFIWTNY